MEGLSTGPCLHRTFHPTSEVGNCCAGNFEYDAHPREIERLFDKYGPLERVDMKTGEAPCSGNRTLSHTGQPKPTIQRPTSSHPPRADLMYPT